MNEKYRYTVVDAIQVVKIGYAETLSEFCEENGFKIQYSFLNCAVLSAKYKYIPDVFYGVTWAAAGSQDA